eukprot:2077308-Ditylum_brightwellii.AAC.1
MPLFVGLGKNGVYVLISHRETAHFYTAICANCLAKPVVGSVKCNLATTTILEPQKSWALYCIRVDGG